MQEYVDLTRRKVYDFNAQRVMPSFKIGKTVAARKLTLTKWIEDLEGS
ncbi:hypothetical protein LP421_07785 [Rhizobium sp. RCAM05350]|nr:hypothetical protein LP421_07785 [Rhizobium sp. RCAM05350]